MKHNKFLAVLFFVLASCAEDGDDVPCSPSPELTCPAECRSHSGTVYDASRKCSIRDDRRAVTCAPVRSTTSPGSASFCLKRGDLILVGMALGIDTEAIDMERCDAELEKETLSYDFCD